MAEIDWNTMSGQQAPRGALSSFATWGGAAMSAALIGGLVVWGWQLTVRDVTGVPVIRAIEGPMRIAPDVPGGTRAAHQGLAVNRVAEDASEVPPAQLVLAPQDQDLVDEDLAVAPPVPEALTTGAVEVSTDPDASTRSRNVAPAIAATDLAVAEALGLTSDAVLGLKSSQDTLAGWSRPEPRPILQRASLVVETPATELDPAELTPGTRLVQLGAYPSPDEARAAWDRLAARFDGYLENKARVIQPANSGGDDFWRLRAAGFADIDDARRFCAALVARQAECIPATVR